MLRMSAKLCYAILGPISYESERSERKLLVMNY